MHRIHAQQGQEAIKIMGTLLSFPRFYIAIGIQGFINLVSQEQEFVIILPLLFFTETDPTSSLIVQTILILVVCWSVLLPTYLPKFFSSEARRVTVAGEIRYVRYSVDESNPFGSNVFSGDFKSPE